MQGKYGAVTAKLYWKKAERIRMAEENLRFERPEYTHQILTEVRQVILVYYKSLYLSFLVFSSYISSKSIEDIM